MTIYNCRICGNYIHVGKKFESKCMYCGSDVEYVEKKDHTYMEMLIDECETALGGSNAVELYDSCIERFPNVGELYWGRFLARHLCVVDKQLLSNGVNFIEDSDYILACHFATDEEKKCYEKVSQIRDLMLTRILSELKTSEKNLILQTNIQVIQVKTASEIDDLRADLGQKMAEIDLVEKMIRDKKNDCMAVVLSNQKMIDLAVTNIDKHMSNINSLQYASFEIEDADYHEWNIVLERDYQVCTKAYADLENTRNTKLYKELNQLQQVQTELQKQVLEIIGQINEVDNRIHKVILRVNGIKEKHKEACECAKRMNFSGASSILGVHKMDSILANALQP